MPNPNPATLCETCKWFKARSWFYFHSRPPGEFDECRNPALAFDTEKSRVFVRGAKLEHHGYCEIERNHKCGHEGRFHEQKSVEASSEIAGKSMNKSEIAEKLRHLIVATRQPFLDEIVAIYNRALPSIIVRESGEIAEYKYSQEVTDAVAKLRELMEEACKSAVESAQKRGEL